MRPIPGSFWLLAAAVAVAATILAPRPAGAVDKIPPDPKGVKLCDDFLKALAIENEAERLKAALPCLHKSMLAEDGKDVNADLKRFSYKKACENAKFYAVPAEVTEVHKGNVQTVGFKGTAEKGRVDKYFVKKKEGQAGRPAPLHVLWPDGGGDPKLVNIGSL